MKGWLLDTNVVAEIADAAGARRVHAWFLAQPRSSLHVSILTLAEYEKGLANLLHGDPRRAAIERLRDGLPSRFTVIPLSNLIVLRWGAISGLVKRATRQSPPVVDTLLAATAIEHDLTLATRNTRDVRHSGATVFDPWTDDPAAFPVTPRR